MRIFFFSMIALSAVFAQGSIARTADNYTVFVTTQRSGDVSVIEGQTDSVLTTIAVGKRPRGIHYSSAGKRVFLVTSGSPRMAPGLDAERAPADRTADGLVAIDAAQRKMVERWHVGSDPEQFAISNDGRMAFIANEDEASVSIVDLSSGQERGRIKVSEEPEGVGVNPANGEVYVTCEEKGDVFVLILTSNASYRKSKSVVGHDPLPFSAMAAALSLHQRVAHVSRSSMQRITRRCGKSRWAKGRCQWELPYRQTVKNSMLPLAARIQSLLSTRKKIRWSRPFPLVNVHGESR